MAADPVVVGVDGSEESLRAVEWAALEASGIIRQVFPQPSWTYRAPLVKNRE